MKNEEKNIGNDSKMWEKNEGKDEKNPVEGLLLSHKELNRKGTIFVLPLSYQFMIYLLDGRLLLYDCAKLAQTVFAPNMLYNVSCNMHSSCCKPSFTSLFFFASVIVIVFMLNSFVILTNF